jgi:serine/threonine protein kinase
MSTPASQLLGLKLNDGWTVIGRLEKLPSQTGGCFSEGYTVVNDNGTKAFLKALDYSGAMRFSDPAPILHALTEAYIFERALLNRCRGMDRVVTGLSDGSVVIHDPNDGDQVVQYLILEFASSGDVRKYLDLSKEFDTAWMLRSLHHLATGLRQLHSAGIAHQDLKPSNALVFDAKVSKVGDLGRASSQGQAAPHENFNIAGDPKYAPPELLFGYLLPDWSHRRLGCDAYLLGGMVVFFFGRANMTAMILTELDATLRPGAWQGTYEEVLPYVREAFERAVGLFAADVERVAPRLREPLTTIVRELCDPDPSLRGDPKERRRGADQYSLERYVTRFDFLASKEEYLMLRK